MNRPVKGSFLRPLNEVTISFNRIAFQFRSQKTFSLSISLDRETFYFISDLGTTKPCRKI